MRKKKEEKEQLPEKLQDYSKEKKGDALEIKLYWLVII